MNQEVKRNLALAPQSPIIHKTKETLQFKNYFNFQTSDMVSRSNVTVLDYKRLINSLVLLHLFLIVRYSDREVGNKLVTATENIVAIKGY
eukprot:snap_masked-scaffold_12-processed-gene-0.38-mRNA-1 protein AED:1.00 eAED:1.00 QI:0/0/0/0/1/1/3/0/89